MSNIALRCLVGAFAVVSITGCDATADRDATADSVEEADKMADDLMNRGLATNPEDLAVAFIDHNYYFKEIRDSGSNVISFKSDPGFESPEVRTYYFKREDVECRTINYPPLKGVYIRETTQRSEQPAYSETECKANGYSQDLAGLKVAHSGKWSSCKADGYARTNYVLREPNMVEVIVNKEYIKPYKKLFPKTWDCYAALTFGKY